MSKTMAYEKKLTEKAKKGIVGILFSRAAIIALLLLIQFAVLIVFLLFFGRHFSTVLGGSSLLGVIMSIYLINTDRDPTIKLTWVIIVLVLPLFGVPFYFYLKSDLGFNAMRRMQIKIEQQARPYQQSMGVPVDDLAEQDAQLYGVAKYLRSVGNYPVFSNTCVEYYPLGEDKLASMLEQLEQAQKYIFMEYFIIDKGGMWSQILDVLIRKARAGVEVRVMYDGTCAYLTLPYEYPQLLMAEGIQCKMYAPVRPFVSTHYNNRDHRKILVIDGHTAFTGGINLADEYINARTVYGHWKDTAVMLKGEAAKSFAIMFLQMWNMSEKEGAAEYKRYIDRSTIPSTEPTTDGWVIPFGDNPFDEHNAGEMMYINILNQAKRYVHIMTPYLIIDDKMKSALCFAALRGVEVKLLLPHIPDKKPIFALAKSHYKALLKAGVDIYEYLPGFVHAKMFVSDDEKAVVGTINLDYRSLYHHFECGVYLHGNPVISIIEDDMIATFAQSQAVTLEDVKKERLTTKIAGRLLKIIAPLL